MAGDKEKKVQEREKLRNLISQWNTNRLDMFWLTEPNEELEFHGAMRFYFQDAGQKVATKCIRVSSTATVSDVIKTLIEKFRPDIRMLSIPEYAIYEIHENGEERKLGDNEKTLFVQLDWHKDDREGRFLLRRMDEKSYISSMDAYDNDNFKRKLSKREKKEKKKREKKERQKAAEENKKNGIAEHLYSELPETSFTRSISNPEAVMRRRRQQKLEQRLKQFCQEGGTDAGGTLRIFGESLNKDVPYKTLLLSMKDTATCVVKEILEKYGHDHEDPAQYCLVQVIIPHHSPSDSDIHDFQNNGSIREYILDDDDCPLLIEHQHHRSRGTLTFHVRRRPADYQPRKRKKKPKPSKSESDANYHPEDSLEKLPYLLELNPDGSETHGPPKKHRLYLNVTEVGSERSSSTRQYLQLFGPNVQPRHCVIAHTEGIVTVTPSSREAETYVNNLRIYETTILQPGMVVRFGKLHTFRFVDPLHIQKNKMLPDPRQSVEFLDRSARREDQLSLHQHGSYETTFDADGNVETVSTHSRDDRMSKKSDDAHSHKSLGRESSQGRGSYEKFESKRGNDPILPAILELWEEGEDAVLSAVITNLDRNHVQFKLSPTYILYMAARFRASTHFRPKSSPSDRAHRLTAFMNKIASLIHQVIQDRYRDAASLAFWLANSSELLHFLKQDRHLSAYTLDAQDLLSESVQLAFRSLVTCQQSKLQTAMIAFLEDRDDMTEKEGTTADVLSVLSSMMNLLRCCRVNAALTIQLLTQSFHDINMWLFNKLICETKPNLCTRLWGVRLKRRLSRIENWAQEQGLELASDCHLSQIVQAAHLLQAPKSNPDDLTSISSFCFKLNSIQLKTVLEKYQNVPEEPPIPRELIDSVVKVAENTADQQVRSEGREVKLEEDTDLQFPFLPEDGYSCDIIRDVPMGLKEFLEPFIQSGFCRLTIQPTSCGFWTIYMSDQDVGRVPSRARSPSVQSNPNNDTESASGWGQNMQEPEVTTISLQKSNNGIGLSIVAAGGVDQDKLGIYVKSVVKGGAADLDGRLQAGDQLLKVDGQSLVGVNQEKAAELMTRTGPVVTLEVAKQGAIYNGLADLLSKPSPIIQRDITSWQRHFAFGLPPSGCENNDNKKPDLVLIGSKDGSHPPIKCFSSALPLNLNHRNVFKRKPVDVIPQNWEQIQTLNRTPLKKKSQNLLLTRGTPTSNQKCKSDDELLENEINNSSYFHHCSTCSCARLKTQGWAPPPSKESYCSNYCPVRSCESAPSPSERLCATCSGKKMSHGFIQNGYLRNIQCYQQLSLRPMTSKPFVDHNCNIPEANYCRNCLEKNPIENSHILEHRNLSSNNSDHSFSKSTNTTALPVAFSTSNKDEPSIMKDRPRRMSERDIPSRVMNEHLQDSRLQPGPGHPMQPRMQSSKSVPSLNSGHHQEPIQPPAIASLRSQEMSNNPAYSRTSSTTSIPKVGEFGEKARSANNLRQDPASVDPKYPFHATPGSDPNPPPYPGPPVANMNVRPISQPNLHKPPPPQPGHGPTLPPGHGPTLPPGHGPTLPPGHGPTLPPGHGPTLPPGHGPTLPPGHGPTLPPGHGPTLPPGHGPTLPSGHGPTLPPGHGPTLPPGHGPTLPPGHGPTLPPGHGPTLPPGHGPTLPPGHGPTLPPGHGPTLQPGHGPTLPPHQPTIPPSHPASSLPEERHYQNISMYQQTPPHYHPQQHQNMYPHTRSPSQPCPPSGRGLHGSQSSLNRPEHQMPNANDRSRPMSTLVSPREQEQYANSMGYAHSPGSGPPPSPKGPIPAGMDPRQHIHHSPYSQRPLPDHRDFRSAEQLRHNENEHLIRAHSMQQHPQYMQDPNQLVDPRQRDLLRQEAKMEEMREEVRRREEREHMMLQQQQMHQAGRGHPAYHPRGPNPNIRPPHAYQQVPPHALNHQGYVGGPPPPAPKPRPMLHNNSNPEHLQRPPRYDNPGGDGSPMYQEMMHPPGPMPNNIRHPNPPPPVVSYRYGPSGYPPRPAMNNAGVRQPMMAQDPRMAAIQGRPLPPHGQNSRVTFELSQSLNPSDRKESNLTSPSPWEREEKEKLHKQRLEEARRARDAEIRELEGAPYMSSKQEERLKTLRLEQEFQRRAEELRGEDDDDDDEELLDRAESRERMLKVQEDMERSRQRRLEWEQEQIQPQHPPKPQHLMSPASQEEWRRQQNNLEEQEGKLRHLRLEEVNRKKELEANRSAEENLLREARRRQDEFKGPHNAHPPLPARPSHLVSHQHIQPGVAPQGMMMQNPNHMKQNIENSNNPDVPPPLPTSPPPVENEYPPNYNMNHSPMYNGPPNGNNHQSLIKNQHDHNHHPQQNSLHRLSNDKMLVEPPAPPMRKSSYEVTNQMASPGSGSVRFMPPSIKNGDGNATQTHHTKKVSFHDPSVQDVGEYDTNGNIDQMGDQSYTLDDIDEVLATPHNTQNLNTYNPGKTPGVIGAQEVYRDPRQRIEAERNQHEIYTGRNPGPEKLTFKEKMKMFAQEVGEPETPKDKVKISRAQRDIETNLNGN